MRSRKSSYSKDDLLKCAEGELFDGGWPRLPRPPMLMFDEIIHVSEDGGLFNGGQISGKMYVSKDLWFFQCHFKDDAVMPGCLGLDGLWQMLGFYLGWRGYCGRGRALGVKEVKFSDQILPPHKCIDYILDIKKILNKNFTLAIADGKINLNGQSIYRCVDLKVGLFPL